MKRVFTAIGAGFTTFIVVNIGLRIILHWEIVKEMVHSTTLSGWWAVVPVAAALADFFVGLYLGKEDRHSRRQKGKGSPTPKEGG